MADDTEKKQTGGTAKPIQLISFWSLQNRPGAPLPPTYPFKKSTGEITESGVFLQQHYMALHQNKVFKIPYLRKIVIASSVFSKHTQWFKLKKKKIKHLHFTPCFFLCSVFFLHFYELSQYEIQELTSWLCFHFWISLPYTPFSLGSFSINTRQ